MNKYDYFKLAHQNGFTLERFWILRAFSQSTPTNTHTVSGVNETNLKRPGFFYYDIHNRPWAVNTEGQVEPIETGRTAVIVKGNPQYVDGNPEAARFYDEIKTFLEQMGFSVQLHPSLPKVLPPKADLWVGHSLGMSRLMHAAENPEYNKVLMIGFGSLDVGVTPFPVINDPEDKLQVGKTPTAAHYRFTEAMRDAIRSLTTVPLFGIQEPVAIKANDFVITKTDYNSYYSNLLLNLLLFEYPFGDLIPYHNGEFTTSFIDKIMVNGLKSREIPIDKYRTFTRVTGFIAFMADIAVPGASERSLTTPPGMLERRNALIEKHKDQLHDPVVVSKIEQELIQYMKEYLKGDVSEGFFVGEKFFNSVLKKTHIMFGGEPKLENPNEVNLAVKSLREGWDLKDLPQMINSLRMGSYNRGASTALGGEAAKFSSRVYQNTRLADEDCGTPVGMPFFITKHNQNAFVGRFMIQGSKVVEITESTTLPLFSTVKIRSPQSCATIDGNYCSVCMGRQVAEAGIGIGPQASAVGSIFLLNFLAAFHAANITTEEYEFEHCIN